MTSAKAQSLREASREAGEAFAAAGITDPHLEARDLLLHVAGIDRSALPGRLDEALSRDQEKGFAEAVAQRLAGTPLDRIMGEREFMGRIFRIDADTLSPREDTAAVIELARRRLDRERPARLLDLGTGSGILLVTLLADCLLASGIGTDLAQGALDMADANATRLGVRARAEFIRSDWLEAIKGQFDLIVSNPPYIETEAIPALEREVREHDPHLALDGGEDGLFAYRAIAAGALAVLNEGGLIVLEIGHGQGEAIRTIFRKAGFVDVAAQTDLAGIERALAFERA